MKNFVVLIISVLMPFVMHGQGAVVAPVNMNILYLGVANPVEIAAPGVPSDKVTATVSNGTITRVTNGWEIVPGNADNCIVTVQANNKKIAEKIFRVKQIPAPVATFSGISNGLLSKETVLKTGSLEVIIPDFAWDMKFTIISFTLNTSSKDFSARGNLLTSEMKAEIARMVRGQSFIFSNIKAKRPDGGITELNAIAIKLE